MQGMALSAGGDITGLNPHAHSSAADNTVSTLPAGKSQGKYPKHRIYTNYWYITTHKHSVIWLL